MIRKGFTSHFFILSRIFLESEERLHDGRGCMESEDNVTTLCVPVCSSKTWSASLFLDFRRIQAAKILVRVIKQYSTV